MHEQGLADDELDTGPDGAARADETYAERSDESYSERSDETDAAEPVTQAPPERAKGQVG
jgi:hypothetical protein